MERSQTKLHGMSLLMADTQLYIQLQSEGDAKAGELPSVEGKERLTRDASAVEAVAASKSPLHAQDLVNVVMRLD
jgi:hypothetical protein